MLTFFFQDKVFQTCVANSAKGFLRASWFLIVKKRGSTGTCAAFVCVCFIYLNNTSVQMVNRACWGFIDGLIYVFIVSSLYPMGFLLEGQKESNSSSFTWRASNICEKSDRGERHGGPSLRYSFFVVAMIHGSVRSCPFRVHVINEHCHDTKSKLISFCKRHPQLWLLL